MDRMAAEAALLSGVRDSLLPLVRKVCPGPLTEEVRPRLQGDVNHLLRLVGFYREITPEVRLRVVVGEGGLADLVWTRDEFLLTEVVG